MCEMCEQTVIFIISIDITVLVFSTGASLPYNHNLIGSLIVKKQIKEDREETNCLLTTIIPRLNVGNVDGTNAARFMLTEDIMSRMGLGISSYLRTLNLKALGKDKSAPRISSKSYGINIVENCYLENRLSQTKLSEFTVSSQVHFHMASDNSLGPNVFGTGGDSSLRFFFQHQALEREQQSDITEHIHNGQFAGKVKVLVDRTQYGRFTGGKNDASLRIATIRNKSLGVIMLRLVNIEDCFICVPHFDKILTSNDLNIKVLVPPPRFRLIIAPMKKLNKNENSGHPVHTPLSIGKLLKSSTFTLTHTETGQPGNPMCESRSTNDTRVFLHETQSSSEILNATQPLHSTHLNQAIKPSWTVRVYPSQSSGRTWNGRALKHWINTSDDARILSCAYLLVLTAHLSKHVGMTAPRQEDDCSNKMATKCAAAGRLMFQLLRHSILVSPKMGETGRGLSKNFQQPNE
ncbi:hypothetical protein CLF_107674 [Clonorchis sinensis]|uniref:Uncharacterized protein n=1 Tax=Clonorchis sinensis TaxID=79923 RepID=G7YH08_CLOSI|nr:hypothetical protein CLF_107674 [Clonorchis sinensis]